MEEKMVDQQDEQNQSPEKSKSPCWGAFNPLQGGDFRASLLTLCSSMVGVGFLTLPEIGKQNGLIPMIFMVFFSAFISCFANLQLARGFSVTKGKCYTRIITLIAGRKYGMTNLVFLFFYVWVSAGACYMFGKFKVTFSCQVRLGCDPK